MTPAITVTVVAYNSDRCLGACLRSIESAVQAGLAEVIVVDNASPDASAHLVATEYPWARLLRSEVNRGFAGGCNLAWPEARGRYWLLLNPDVVVPPDGLRLLVGWMDERRRLGAASPELVDPDGGLHSAARRFPWIWRVLLEASRLHLLLPRQWREDVFLGSYRMVASDRSKVDWVPGTALVARREAVEAAGLLAEDLPLYGEDMEWCWRIHRAGWDVGVCGQLRFEHSEGDSVRRSFGDQEREQRMWGGMKRALTRMRGDRYAAGVLWASAFALAIEVLHPARSKASRSRAFDQLRALRSALW